MLLQSIYSFEKSRSRFDRRTYVNLGIAILIGKSRIALHWLKSAKKEQTFAQFIVYITDTSIHAETLYLLYFNFSIKF